jgi:hypothetical protein
MARYYCPSRNVAPDVVEDFASFATTWPSVWLVYEVGRPCHWKMTDVWRFCCAVTDRLGRRAFREYQVRARKRHTALAKVFAAIAGPFPVTVTLYHVSRPMTRACIAEIERFNARFAKERDARVRAAG